jgi:hypothetical protein
MSAQLSRGRKQYRDSSSSSSSQDFLKPARKGSSWGSGSAAVATAARRPDHNIMAAAERIVVAIDASRDITKHALEWALTNVAVEEAEHYCITLLALLPSANGGRHLLIYCKQFAPNPLTWNNICHTFVPVFVICLEWWQFAKLWGFAVLLNNFSTSLDMEQHHLQHIYSSLFPLLFGMDGDSSQSMGVCTPLATVARWRVMWTSDHGEISSWWWW